MNKLFVFTILLILILPGVLSLGVSPGRTTLNYEPGIEKEIAISVFNNEHRNIKVGFSVQGELKNYITLSKNSGGFGSDEESKQLIYKLKLPENLKDSPGLHTAEIIITEFPENETESGTHIGANVAVVSQLFVYVPCPGKCIDADLNVLDAQQNSTATFIVPVINRGESEINKVKATIEIYNGQARIAVLETNSASLAAGKRTELISKWQVDASSGTYLAKISVFYDENEKNFEKNFEIGGQVLDIERVWVNDFRLGGIAKFRILVENKWNRELKNVFANLIVYDNKGFAMVDSKSASEDIPMTSKKELLAYWDTAGVEIGEYNGKLMINYEKSALSKSLILKVNENSLDISGVGYAIMPEAGKGISITVILITIIIILVIGNLIWFLIFKKLKKKKNKTAKNIIKV